MKRHFSKIAKVFILVEHFVCKVNENVWNSWKLLVPLVDFVLFVIHMVLYCYIYICKLFILKYAWHVKTIKCQSVYKFMSKAFWTMFRWSTSPCYLIKFTFLVDRSTSENLMQVLFSVLRRFWKLLKLFQEIPSETENKHIYPVLFL